MDINKYTPKDRIKNKSLTKISDLSTEEIYEILYAARLFKNRHLAKEPHMLLKNKIIAVISNDSSKLDCLPLKMAIRQMGASSVNLNLSEYDSDGGNVTDPAKILSGYGLDGAVIFSGSQAVSDAFSKYSKLPVINGGNSFSNPCQALSDLFTVWENKGTLGSVKIAYFGNGKNNTANSLLLAAVKCGANVYCACPEGFEPYAVVMEKAMQYGDYKITPDTAEAIKNADVIYTDNYRDADAGLFERYQVNKALFAKAKSDAIFLHPLPARRGIEVTAEIADGEHSLIYRQAENRLHTEKAVLSLLVK